MSSKYLIFSESNPDGVQLTFDEYTELMKTMSHEDFETHQAIPVCSSIEELLAEVLQKPN